MRGTHQNLQLMMFCPCFLLCVGLLPPFFFLFCCCCLFSCVSFFLYLSQSPAFMPVSPSVALEAKRKAQLTCVLCACLSFGWRGKKHEEKGGAEKEERREQRKRKQRRTRERDGKRKKARAHHLCRAAAVLTAAAASAAFRTGTLRGCCSGEALHPVHSWDVSPWCTCPRNLQSLGLSKPSARNCVMHLQESSGACRAAVICEEQISSDDGGLGLPPPLPCSWNSDMHPPKF